MEKIITNYGKSIKILREDDLQVIGDVHKYKNLIESQCDELLANTHKKCVELENATQQKIDEQLLMISNEIYDLNLTKIKTFVDNTANSLENLLREIITKLNINNITTNQLTTIIYHTINQTVNLKNIVIYCNNDDLILLSQQLKDFIDSDQIKFKSDTSIVANNQCRIETDYLTIFVELDQCRDKILEIIKFNH